MAGVTVAGIDLAVARPRYLLALPVAVAVVAALALVRARGDWPRRKRALFLAARMLVVVCLVVAAAGPYTVQTMETAGDPRVTMLVDESTSMAATDADPDALAARIEERGVPVTSRVVASGNSSRVGDGVVANVEPNGSLLVVSDGQVTGGRSLSSAAGVAARANATVHAVDVEATATDRRVSLAGPATTSVGVSNAFLVSVGGVNADASATVTVRTNETVVFTDTVDGTGRAQFTYAFDEVGTHRLTVTVESDDRFGVDDTYRRTVRVVPRPRVLYVAQGEYPLGGLLDRLYNVTRRERVPSDLSPYQTVVMRDVPADAAGNVSALQRAVIDGTGLVVAGGDDAYAAGDYGNSSLGSMLPVSTGNESGRTARIVLLVDASGSSKRGMAVQKSLALDVLDQLGGGNRVGLVAFDYAAYDVADVRPLEGNRTELSRKIRRLKSGGVTYLGTGLQGAADKLDGPGTVILLSDGVTDGSEARAVAERMASNGVRIVSVGVGQDVNEPLLRSIAGTTGGTYLRAGQTSRLRLLFGGPSRTYSGDTLTVVDGSQFITAGLELTADPAKANDVAVKSGADYLVATSDGQPAVAQWRYGLGRVVSITAYGADGTLDGLLERPDSLVVSKSVNWAVGDPTQGDGATAADTRVGAATTVRYTGSERPAPPPSFRRVAPDTYAATVQPDSVGFQEVAGATFAANYPREYGALGQSDALDAAVERTGGRVFAPSEAAAIARTVTERARRTRDVRTEWGWAFLLAALAAFLLETVARRLSAIRSQP
ncbi:vWA domain-containing protein [Halorarius halobius]|uniref:vWA domain-containing protein n=1 Tax=Halorarius halobius TaxID=2962671 RepID=UPI0020CD9466|nr:vWA domain-containing protein [Halorarius halobius]